MSSSWFIFLVSCNVIFLVVKAIHFSAFLLLFLMQSPCIFLTILLFGNIFFMSKLKVFLHISGLSFFFLISNLSLSKYIRVSISFLLLFLLLVDLLLFLYFFQALSPVSPTMGILLSLLLCSPQVPSFWLSTNCGSNCGVLLFQMDYCGLVQHLLWKGMSPARNDLLWNVPTRARYRKVPHRSIAVCSVSMVRINK